MTTPLSTHQDRFHEWCRTLTDLEGISSLLGWDREGTMPSAAGEARARHSGLLASLVHRELIREDYEETLAALGDDGLEPAVRRQVELMRRRRDRAMKIPEDLVRALSEARSRAVSVWVTARPAGDWDTFAAPFAEVVARSRDVAEILANGQDPYDALLDDFEPGTKAADLEPVFSDLRDRLAPVVAERAGDPVSLPVREWSHEAQMRVARAVATRIGYDLDRGVIGTTAHPFTCTVGENDVRFSTRHTLRDPLENVLIVLHEAGHAMYEQGLPAEYRDTPVHDAPSLGAHESQSRFWENHVGRSTAFWEQCMPLLVEEFGDAMNGISRDHFVRAANSVSPSLIRVDADEATYNLHIALRFDLELRIIRHQIEVKDLPDAWNTLMQELLGIQPTGPADGVMQDIHWPEGLFGYFPTYTLGTLYAAQLAEAVDTRVGGLDDAVATGRFDEILGFMREHVHQHGALFPTPVLMEKATGGPLTADALIRHLSRAPDA